MRLALWVGTLLASAVIVGVFINVYLTRLYGGYIAELEKRVRTVSKERDDWKRWVHECEERITSVLRKSTADEETL